MKNLHYNGNISSMQWQNGTSVAKSRMMLLSMSSSRTGTPIKPFVPVESDPDPVLPLFPEPDDDTAPVGESIHEPINPFSPIRPIEPVQETAGASALYKVLSYNYYTQDHLGNNRAVIDEGGNVKQVTNYYPFGGVFSTTVYNSGDDLQPYKYNGKELDRTHGLDWYDYGARNYDAFLPMFTPLDPHCESYYNISPYAYCANNPIMFVDPDGENPVFSSNGMFLGCTSEGYTGQIYIYNFNADLPEDEILDVSKLSDYSIKELSNFNGVSSMDDVELSGDAIGNIMTNILERWDGKMVFDEKFTMASINNRVRYDNPKNCDWNFESRYYPGEKNGKIYVSPLYKDSYESTVENLEATMLGHEWYSHIIKDYGDDHNNHSLAYENSMRFSLIYNKSLTPKYIDFCGVMLWCYRYNEFFHKTK